MIKRAILSHVLLLALPVWSQVGPAATGGDVIPDDGTEMRTPPIVSGEAYPTETGAEEESNYVRAGLTVDTAYVDNVLPLLSGTNPISDIIYSIRPTIAIDKMVARLHQALTYSPGFTLYQHTSARNLSNQSASLNSQYRLSPHISASVRDTFALSSNVFDQSYSEGTVTDSPQTPLTGAIAPIADRHMNAANGNLTYQISMNAMVGVGGTATKLTYPNLAEVPGLCDSNSHGGSAFYNRRLSESQYMGVSYQYSKYLACPVNEQSLTNVHTLYLFYTFYWTKTLSLSVSGGPQHYDASVISLPTSASWTPAITSSIGWQGNRVNIAANYSRTITGGGGLLGSFNSNSANMHARWQSSRNWTIDSAGSYQIRKNVGALPVSSSQGGHTVSGTVSMERTIGMHLTAKFGYERLHQSYGRIVVIDAAPDSNREFISVSYQLKRPLGR